MKQLAPALFTVGAIMALTGAAVFITGWFYAPYIYTICLLYTSDAADD